MKFSFVVLTWNRKAFLEKCVTGLLESVGKSDCEIIVLDNGSDDGTEDFLRTFASDPRFRLLRNETNRGLGAYKKLFSRAKGEFIVIVDDDVIEFPENITSIFEEYFAAFPDFAFLALDVVQNGYTNGAKPPASNYREFRSGDRIVEFGPTGGWCSAFRRRDYNKIRPLFYLWPINMKGGEDGLLSHLFARILRKKSGIIKGKYCLHACGPYYSKQFGYLDRDIEKYAMSGFDKFADWYRFFK